VVKWEIDYEFLKEWAVDSQGQNVMGIPMVSEGPRELEKGDGVSQEQGSVTVTYYATVTANDLVVSGKAFDGMGIEDVMNMDFPFDEVDCD
jgi:hypothetical protein